MMLNGWCLGKDGIGARIVFFFFQAEDGIRDKLVTGLQTCALPICGFAVINTAALDMLRGDHSALGGEVRRYTKRDLRGKLEQAGFSVKRLTYTNASLFPITAAVRSEERRVGEGVGHCGEVGRIWTT